MGGQAPPDAATRARSGRLAGGRRSRGCPGAGYAGRRPVRVLCPPCGRPSNRSSGRPVSTRPVSTRPAPSRCPDGRASGVRGSAAALSGPRWTLEWLGAAGRPRWAQWVRCAAEVRGRRGRLPAPGLTGRDGAGLAVVARTRVAGRPGPPHHRRTGCGAALGAWPTSELVQRQGAGRLARSTRTPQLLTNPPGASWAGAGVVPTMGLDREVVTTLCGRWIGDGPVSSVPQGPSGSAGEQTAAAARPRHVRSAVGQALTGR
jgi:hypothetical protein